MDDFVRLIFYLLIGLVWFLSHAPWRRRGPGPVPPGPVPQQPSRRPAPQPTPWPIGSGRKIIVRSRQTPPAPTPQPARPAPRPTLAPVPVPATAAEVAFTLDALLAQRAPATAAGVTSAPTPPTQPASHWLAALASQEKIAEGIVLSAILGPPKASEYFRRVRRLSS